MNKWNIRKNEQNKFFKLSNGQWFKIMFSYIEDYKAWFMTIVIGNSKRQCNDCARKTRNSPKVYLGKPSGNKCGIEPFMIALRELIKFEKRMNNIQINIMGASKRLINIYKYLERYGYKEYVCDDGELILYKKIKE